MRTSDKLMLDLNPPGAWAINPLCNGVEQPGLNHLYGGKVVWASMKMAWSLRFDAFEIIPSLWDKGTTAWIFYWYWLALRGKRIACLDILLAVILLACLSLCSFYALLFCSFLLSPLLLVGTVFLLGLLFGHLARADLFILISWDIGILSHSHFVCLI